MRHYYKTADGKGILNVETPLDDENLIEITEQEFYDLQPVHETRQQTEAEKRIEELKSLLKSWDYKTSKYVDGDYTDEEWQQIVAQRKAWREEINALEESENK